MKLIRIVYAVLKRTFDLLFSMLALAVTSPLWLIIAIGIKLSSPGPVFYVSKRAGKNLEEFPFYKFRSMHVYDPKKDLIDEKKNWFVAKDYRIFKFGSFLRKSKLDELPQLLNIIFSQMSIIGPRPLSQAGAKRLFFGEYACIADVKPGLTALDSLYDYAHGDLFVTDNAEYQNNVLPVRTELARMYVEEKHRTGCLLHCQNCTVNFADRYTAKKRVYIHKIRTGSVGSGKSKDCG